MTMADRGELRMDAWDGVSTSGGATPLDIFKGDFRTFPATFVETKPGLLGQNTIFSWLQNNDIVDIYSGDSGPFILLLMILAATSSCPKILIWLTRASVLETSDEVTHLFADV